MDMTVMDQDFRAWELPTRFCGQGHQVGAIIIHGIAGQMPTIAYTANGTIAFDGTASAGHDAALEATGWGETRW